MVKEQIMDAFVARIWLERGTDGNPIWRGHIRHVQGDQETYFQSLGGISEFLERVTGVPGPGSAAAPKASTGRSTD